jgi:hypothetical protein
VPTHSSHGPLRSLIRFVLLLVVVAFVTPGGPAESGAVGGPMYPDLRPFRTGERLTYAISYLNVRAGTAVLEVQNASPVDGRATLKLVSTAKSSSVLSKIYPVDNFVESLIDAETLSPYHMVFHRREGRKKNDFDLTFRHLDGTVLSVKDGVGETLAIPPLTHDLISCLYYVRNLTSMEPGSSLVLNLHHDKKNYRVEVRMEGVERVHGAWGDVEAIRVLVVMPFQGLFLNEGNIRVWLSNDDRRLPIVMKAKVIIGSVVAKLIF